LRSFLVGSNTAIINGFLVACTVFASLAKKQENHDSFGYEILLPGVITLFDIMSLWF
jgi:hypothetical protein